MKIERVDENTIIVFLNKLKVKEKLLLSNNYLENYFRSLFQQLKNNYQINISGYYHITLYQDSIYGVIMYIEKEFTDYFDYFDNQVDMKIDIAKDSVILYELDNFSILSKQDYDFLNIYYYDNKIYIKPKKVITQMQLGKVIENCNIVYGDLCKQILKKGKLIKSKYVFV